MSPVQWEFSEEAKSKAEISSYPFIIIMGVQ